MTVTSKQRVLKIDRSKPFDPCSFFHEKGWRVLGNDKHSLALTEIDLQAVCLYENVQRDSFGTRIDGDEALKMLVKTRHIRLDAKIFQTFLENQDMIPECFKKVIRVGRRNELNEYVRVCCDGTLLVGPRYPINTIMYLEWDDGMAMGTSPYQDPGTIYQDHEPGWTFSTAYLCDGRLHVDQSAIIKVRK